MKKLVVGFLVVVATALLLLTGTGGWTWDGTAKAQPLQVDPGDGGGGSALPCNSNYYHWVVYMSPGQFPSAASSAPWFTQRFECANWQNNYVMSWGGSWWSTGYGPGNPCGYPPWPVVCGYMSWRSLDYWP